MRLNKAVWVCLLVSFLIRTSLGGEAALQGESPSQTRNVIAVEGKTYPCTSEFWTAPCIVINNNNQQLGMHQILLQIRRDAQNATLKGGLEAEAPFYTARSLPLLKRLWDEERKVRARYKDTLPTTRPAEQYGQIYLVVRFIDETGEYIVMAENPLQVAPPANSGPEFPTTVLAKEEGEWRFDQLLMYEHPVVRAIRKGHWKQFGADKDVLEYIGPLPATRPNGKENADKGGE